MRLHLISSRTDSAESPGAAFMNLLLQKFGELDDTAFVDNGYGSWSEANQKNQKNNPYIVEAVKELLASTCGQR